MKYNRIMFAGPSGIGKTTLASWLSTEYSKYQFISGSMSDLVKGTKEMSHKDMLSRDPKDLYLEDYQLVNLRNKLFQGQEYFVTDRSYLDSAAYFLYKQAKVLPQCEVEHFIMLCGTLLAKQCDLLILIDFPTSLVNTWYTEDNNKRITNNYFQVEISSIMYTTLKLMGYHELEKTNLLKDAFLPSNQVYTKEDFEVGIIKNIYGDTPVLIISTPELSERMTILRNFIQDEEKTVGNSLLRLAHKFMG